MGIMNLAEIMDRSIEILKKYIKTIIMFSIGYGAILFAGLFVFIFAGAIFVAASGLFANIIFTVVIGVIACFILIGFSLTVNVGITKIAGQEFFEERIYAGSAIGESWKSIIKVCSITTIGLISFIPAVVIFSTPIYFIYINSKLGIGSLDNNAQGIYMVIAIIICILYILAAIAVVIGYITMFSFALQAVTIEKKSIISSISRSFNLVRHDFWKIYGCVALFGITIYIIRYSLVSFLGLVVSIVFLILKVFNVEQNYTTFLTAALVYANWPVTLILWCVVTPIGTIMVALLYFNQRFKKEGYDLVLRLKEIQKNQEKEREQLNEDNASAQFNKSL